MRPCLLLFCWGLPLAVAFLLVTGPAQAAQPLPSSRYVEGELLVKFQGGPRGDSAAQARQTFKHEVKRRFDRVGWQHIQLPPGLTVARAQAEYQRHPAVLAVEPNYVFHLALAGPSGSLVPNDPQFSLKDAWLATRGAAKCPRLKENIAFLACANNLPFWCVIGAKRKSHFPAPQTCEKACKH